MATMTINGVKYFLNPVDNGNKTPIWNNYNLAPISITTATIREYGAFNSAMVLSTENTFEENRKSPINLTQPMTVSIICYANAQNGTWTGVLKLGVEYTTSNGIKFSIPDDGIQDRAFSKILISFIPPAVQHGGTTNIEAGITAKADIVNSSQRIQRGALYLDGAIKATKANLTNITGYDLSLPKAGISLKRQAALGLPSIYLERDQNFDLLNDFRIMHRPDSAELRVEKCVGEDMKDLGIWEKHYIVPPTILAYPSNPSLGVIATNTIIDVDLHSLGTWTTSDFATTDGYNATDLINAGGRVREHSTLKLSNQFRITVSLAYAGGAGDGSVEMKLMNLNSGFEVVSAVPINIDSASVSNKIITFYFQTTRTYDNEDGYNVRIVNGSKAIDNFRILNIKRW